MLTMKSNINSIVKIWQIVRWTITWTKFKKTKTYRLHNSKPKVNYKQSSKPLCNWNIRFLSMRKNLNFIKQYSHKNKATLRN